MPAGLAPGGEVALALATTKMPRSGAAAGKLKYEPKWDGYRTIGIRDNNGATLGIRRYTSGGHSWKNSVATDALGSVIALTDSAQAKAATYTYDSWGTGTAAAANPWRYAGGYKDNTSNLTKFGARYYNPGTGRFTQPDPSGQETNNYLYAGANPIIHTDSSGLDFWSDVVAVSVPEIVGCAVSIVGGRCRSCSGGVRCRRGW